MYFFLLTGTGSLMKAIEKARESRLPGLPWMSVRAIPAYAHLVYRSCGIVR